MEALLFKGKRALGYVYMVGMIVIGVIIGCSGGTRGTGGVDFTGRVVSLNNTPIADVTVLIPETGDSAVTDAAGEFNLSSDVTPGSVVLNVSTNNFSDDVVVTGVTDKTVRVSVTLKVDEENERVDFDDVTVEDDDHDSGGGDTPRRTPTPRPTHGGDDTDNEPTPAATETPEPGATPTPVATVTPTSDDGDHDGHEDGEDAEAEGRVQSISSTSITVDGETFQITSGTRFVDEEGSTISSSLVVTGSEVHVRGTWENDVAYANRVELKD